MRLRRVADHSQSVLLRQSRDRRHVRGLPVEVHRNDGLGLRRDLRLDLIDVDVVGRGVDVDEHHLRAGHLDRLGRGDEGVGDRDDLVTRADTQRLQRDEQRVGSVGNADAMTDPAVLREGLLERLDERAADEGGLLDHGGDRRVDLGFDGLVLRLQIDKRNVHVVQCLIESCIVLVARAVLRRASIGTN